MIISTKELVVLVEALKSTTAYQNNHAKLEGKILAPPQIGTRNKNELIFDLTQRLSKLSECTENLAMNDFINIDIGSFGLVEP